MVLRREDEQVQTRRSRRKSIYSLANWAVLCQWMGGKQWCNKKNHHDYPMIMVIRTAAYLVLIVYQALSKNLHTVSYVMLLITT